LPYYSLLILEIIDKLYYLFYKNDRSFVQNVCDFYGKYDRVKNRLRRKKLKLMHG